MQLRRKLQRLHEYEHEAHVATLILVAIGVFADWLGTFLPTRFHIAPLITHALHWLHYLSLGLVVVYAGARLSLARRPSKEIAALLPSPKPTHRILTPGSEPKAYSYRGRPVPQDDREFVTDPTSPLALALYQMNQTAYEGSAFELTLAEVTKRDSAIITRNSHAFMVFRDPNRELTTPVEESTIEDYVGYSAVFPINDTGKDVYLRGLIPDTRFPESLVCPDKDKAAMLLFFAMHLRKPYRARNAGQKYSLLLARCIEEHIRIVARAHAEAGDQIEVWVQSEDQSMRDHYIYRGFEISESRSCEGFPFYYRSITVT